jgi:3-hydroxyacyl-[acyl-carrier-protein] dehydratase
MSGLFTTTEKKIISIDGLTLRKIMPHGYPFQMFDKVKSYDHEKGRTIGLKNVAQNDPFIQGHFPGNPIFPGVLIIEALAQTAGCGWMVCELIEKGIAPEDFGSNVHEVTGMATILAESKIKHTSPVYPGDQIELDSVFEFRRGDMCRCKVCATVDGREVSKGQLTMAKIPWQTPGQSAPELPS